MTWSAGLQAQPAVAEQSSKLVLCIIGFRQGLKDRPARPGRHSLKRVRPDSEGRTGFSLRLTPPTAHLSRKHRADRAGDREREGFFSVNSSYQDQG